MPDETKARVMIPVVAEAMVWMVVLANVRLALRHPDNHGDLGDYAQVFADRLEQALVDEGVYSPEDIAELRRLEMRGFN